MRNLAFIVPFAAAAALAGAAVAQPTVNVTLGDRLQSRTGELGVREVQEQADRLAEVVSRAIADDADL
ncbi:MAG: hypothetical protein EON85_11035, partial [Brevundimonas sp.]